MRLQPFHHTWLHVRSPRLQQLSYRVRLQSFTERHIPNAFFNVVTWISLDRIWCLLEVAQHSIRYFLFALEIFGLWVACLPRNEIATHCQLSKQTQAPAIKVACTFRMIALLLCYLPVCRERLTKRWTLRDGYNDTLQLSNHRIFTSSTRIFRNTTWEKNEERGLDSLTCSFATKTYIAPIISEGVAPLLQSRMKELALVLYYDMSAAVPASLRNHSPRSVPSPGGFRGLWRQLRFIRTLIFESCIMLGY